jgi:hypothetical protein
VLILEAVKRFIVAKICRSIPAFYKTMKTCEYSKLNILL